MGFMNKVMKEDLFLVDFTYQPEIAKKAKEAGAQGISLFQLLDQILILETITSKLKECLNLK